MATTTGPAGEAGGRGPEPSSQAAAPATPLEASRRAATFRALRNPNYRLYYFSQAISLSGTWMQSIAQAWLVVKVLHISDPKLALGLVTMFQFLPITIFVLPAGVLADRVPKRPLILCTQVLAMCQAIALTVLVWSGRIELWHLYVLAPLLGLANGIEQPTRQAFVVDLVGRDDVLNAVALNSGIFNGARLIGPAIGGVIIATAGVKLAFLLNGISFIPIIGALLLMDASKLYSVETKRGRVHPMRELMEGLSYAFRTPAALLIIIVVAIVGTFGYNFTVLLPLVDRYQLHRGEIAFGLLTATLGFGAFISALVIAGERTASKRMLFVGGAIFAILLAAAGFSRSLYLTIPLLFGVGLASTAFSATANTSLQLTTPDHLRGRVMGIYMLLFAGSTPIGGLLTGVLAHSLSVSAAVGIEAALSLLGVLAGLAYYLAHREQIPLEPAVIASSPAGG